MSQINKEIPAFPIPLLGDQSWQGMSPCDGMTLRDYFAAKAMTKLLELNKSVKYSLLCDASYDIANEMMKAREQ